MCSSHYNELQSRLGSWIVKDEMEWLTKWYWFVTESEEFLFFQVTPNKWRRHVQKLFSHNSYHDEFSTYESPEEKTFVHC